MRRYAFLVAGLGLALAAAACHSAPGSRHGPAAYADTASTLDPVNACAREGTLAYQRVILAEPATPMRAAQASLAAQDAIRACLARHGLPHTGDPGLRPSLAPRPG